MNAAPLLAAEQAEQICQAERDVRQVASQRPAELAERHAELETLVEQAIEPLQQRLAAAMRLTGAPAQVHLRWQVGELGLLWPTCTVRCADAALAARLEQVPACVWARMVRPLHGSQDGTLELTASSLGWASV